MHFCFHDRKLDKVQFELLLAVVSLSPFFKFLKYFVSFDNFHCRAIKYTAVGAVLLLLRNLSPDNGYLKKCLVYHSQGYLYQPISHRTFE